MSNSRIRQASSMPSGYDPAGSARSPNHSYSTGARGLEFLMGYYPFLDRAPGRGEGDSPTFWIRRHDEY
jgi:predicted dithiol-disulfide oxidoreductase (DUF899 family)